MARLVVRLWHGHQRYNAEADALESADTRPVVAIGGLPPRYVYKPVKHGSSGGFRRVDGKPQPVKPKRAGFLGGWF